MLKKIVLIGGGGHCISAIDVIECQNEFKILKIIQHTKINIIVKKKNI